GVPTPGRPTPRHYPRGDVLKASPGWPGAAVVSRPHRHSRGGVPAAAPIHKVRALPGWPTPGPPRRAVFGGGRGGGRGRAGVRHAPGQVSPGPGGRAGREVARRPHRQFHTPTLLAPRPPGVAPGPRGENYFSARRSPEHSLAPGGHAASAAAGT